MSLVVYEEHPFYDVYVDDYWRVKSRNDVADLAARRLAARNLSKLKEANRRADEAEQQITLRFQREIERNNRVQDFSLEQADRRERRLQKEIEKADERADEAENLADEQADKRVRRFKRAVDEAEERADEAEERANAAVRRVAEMESLLEEYRYRLTKAEEKVEAFRALETVGPSSSGDSGDSGDSEDSEDSGDSQDSDPQVSGVSSEVVCPDIVQLLFP